MKKEVNIEKNELNESQFKIQSFCKESMEVYYCTWETMSIQLQKTSNLEMESRSNKSTNPNQCLYWWRESKQ